MSYVTDMNIDAPTSEDVSRGSVASSCDWFAPAVLPEAQGSLTGVSTRCAMSSKQVLPIGRHNCHWYALRTTYGREKQAYQYIIDSQGIAFYPTQIVARRIRGKIKLVEESLLPNLFFAYGTEEEIKHFVFDNIHLPYLRFYYRHRHIGTRIEKEPLIVPNRQMESLRLICGVRDSDVIISEESVRKFKAGQMVRVVAGEFEGVVGVVSRYRGQQRVGVVIDGLLTVATAYIPNAFLEHIDT